MNGMGEGMPARTATFDLGVDAASLDEREIEAAWNAWTNDLRAEGLRPAEVPTRWTDESATFRVFEVGIDHEAEFFTLDFDIRKLLGRTSKAISFATYPLGLGALVYALAQHAAAFVDVIS